MRTRRPVLSLVILAALASSALAGCASEEASLQSPTTSVPVPTTSPSPPAIAEPIPPFGGQCANLLDEEAARTIVGDTRVYAEGTVVPADAPEWRFALETSGGIICEWEGAAHFLTVIALPSEVATPALRAEYGAASCIQVYDSSECRGAREVNGTWILSTFLSGMDVPSQPPAELALSLDVMARNAAEFDAPLPVTRTAATWAGIDCAELGAQIDVVGILGTEDYFEAFPTEGPGSLDWRIASAIGAVSRCEWTTIDSPWVGIGVYLLPGAAWSFEAQAAAGVASLPIDIAGAASAVVAPDRHGQEELLMTDAHNVLRLNHVGTAVATEIAAGVLRYANGVD